MTNGLASCSPILSFARTVTALREMGGRIAPLELGENGSAYNHLAYMAVLLSAVSEQTDTSLRILLVEEPEAHLHPQLQVLLMRFLKDETGGPTQVIVTDHSPNFGSAAGVERLAVVARAAMRRTGARRCCVAALTPK